MRSNLEKCLSLIFGHEGGFSNRPLKVDPGGPTKWGVTLATLRAYRGRATTVEDVRNLTIMEAAEIYRKQYAAPIRFDDLPSGVDYMMLDYSINSGPAQAVKTIQRVLGVSPVDGVMGMKTMTAIKAANDRDTINKVMDARWTFMTKLKNFGPNKNGWRTRIANVRKGALAMVAPRGSVLAQENKPLGEVSPAMTYENAQAIDAGADAKALPAEIRVTATQTGSGIATAGAGGIVATATDTLRPMVGGGGALDHVFVVLTLIGVAVALYGLWMAYKGHRKELRSGAPV